MTDLDRDWTSFDAWVDFLEEPWPAACPFWHVPLTRETRFLYYESTAPLPCCFYFGFYACAPDWRILAAELRHVILPRCFGRYLCRHRWSDPHVPMPADALIRGARRAGWSDSDGLPVMETILKSVDCAIASPDEPTGWRWLEEANRVFNHEWRTAPWIFAFSIFPSLDSLMQEVVGVSADGDLYCDPDDPEDPGLLSRRCFDDPEANLKLREYFQQYERL